MNATKFFTEETFNRIKADIKQEKILEPYDNPYRKTLKINGNTYELMVCTGRYTYEEAKGQYYTSLWDSYSYKDNYGSRSIGGSAGGSVNIESYEAFKECVNKRLSQFPDYTEEEQPLQLAIAF